MQMHKYYDRIIPIIEGEGCEVYKISFWTIKFDGPHHEAFWIVITPLLHRIVLSSRLRGEVEVFESIEDCLDSLVGHIHFSIDELKGGDNVAA